MTLCACAIQSVLLNCSRVELADLMSQFRPALTSLADCITCCFVISPGFRPLSEEELRFHVSLATVVLLLVHKRVAAPEDSSTTSHSDTPSISTADYTSALFQALSHDASAQLLPNMLDELTLVLSILHELLANPRGDPGYDVFREGQVRRVQEYHTNKDAQHGRVPLLDSLWTFSTWLRKDHGPDRPTVGVLFKAVNALLQGMKHSEHVLPLFDM